MKSKLGVFLIVLGLALLLGAAFLYYNNRTEDRVAQNAVVDVMPQLVEQIQKNTALEQTMPEAIPEQNLQIPVELLTEEDKAMTEVEINGHWYIGYLSIPNLGLDLPIMSDWSYPKLNVAPCRYVGSVRGEDLVLMAHNYNSHFGRISQLNLGDSVFFTDMDGNTIGYEVVGEDLLDPTAVEEMTSGDFDLTLFTCTYGGGSRVTVYCDRISE